MSKEDLISRRMASEPLKRSRIEVMIRWALRADLPQLVHVESMSFPDPWSSDDFLSILRQKNVLGIVAEFDEQVVGFLVYEFSKGQFDVVSLAVHPDYRRREIGRQLVEHLERKAAKQDRPQFRVDVREGNLNAQLFLRSIGFIASRVVRKAYPDTGEDAYCFERRITSRIS